MLRHDAVVDGPADVAVERLGLVFEAVLGPDADLDVFLEDRPMGEGDWTLLGGQVDACVSLPSSAAGERAFALRAMGAPVLTDAAAVAAWNEGLPSLVERVRVVRRLD